MDFLYNVLKGIIHGGIPATLIILGFTLTEDSKNEAKFWIESLALWLAGLGFYYAERASRKSQETETQLISYGLSSAENKTAFRAIFNEHLVDRLNQFWKKGGKIYLLLSTPAYGYAVVGSGTFNNFVKALETLGHDCELELIFFSPDDHFSYWANVLLWTEIRLQEGKETRFSEQFADGITDVFVQFKAHSNWKLWVTQTTTVREFAFFPKVQDMDDQSDGLVNRIYVVLTDPFSVSQDQFRAGFQARSIRVPSFDRREYAGDSESYFERIKVCPYTGRSGEEVGLTPNTHENELEALMVDYLLGRTHRSIMEAESFRSEIKVFLTSDTVGKIMAGGITQEQLLHNILRQILRYYIYVLEKRLVGANLSAGQGQRLIHALQSCNSISEGGNEFRSEIDQLLTKIRGLRNELSATESLQINELPKRIEATEAAIPVTHNDVASKLTDCIYALLSSGFGESRYASNLVSRVINKSQITHEEQSIT